MDVKCSLTAKNCESYNEKKNIEQAQYPDCVMQDLSIRVTEKASDICDD